MTTFLEDAIAAAVALDTSNAFADLREDADSRDDSSDYRSRNGEQTSPHLRPRSPEWR